MIHVPTGVIGFRINGQDKLTRITGTHTPNTVGVSAARFISETTPDLAADIATKIRTVRNDIDVPTLEDISQCCQWADFSVGRKSVTDWHCLLHKAEGQWGPFLLGVPFMYDAGDFIKDSTRCKAAYIFDLDTDTLEIYASTKELGIGRYDAAYYGAKGETPFTGNKLVYSIHAQVLRVLSNAERTALMHHLSSAFFKDGDPALTYPASIPDIQWAGYYVAVAMDPALTEFEYFKPLGLEHLLEREAALVKRTQRSRLWRIQQFIDMIAYRFEHEDIAPTIEQTRAIDLYYETRLEAADALMQSLAVEHAEGKLDLDDADERFLRTYTARYP